MHKVGRGYHMEQDGTNSDLIGDQVYTGGFLPTSWKISVAGSASIRLAVMADTYTYSYKRAPASVTSPHIQMDATSAMQSPTTSRYITHSSLHIRDARDALILFEAVRLNILPLITRRLNGNERSHLRSGNIFVWEESESKGALSRWTDGRRWSQSRMRGDYLWYQEQTEISQEEREAKAARRARRALDPTRPPSVISRRQDRPAKPGGLIKQTYSTLVRHASGCKKWHIVAYFSEDDYLRLPIVDNYEYLRQLCVPENVFMPGKASTRKLDHPDASLAGEVTPTWSSSPRVDQDPAFPPSLQSRDSDGSSTSTRSPSSSPEIATISFPLKEKDQERLQPLPHLSLLAPMPPPASHTAWNSRGPPSRTRGGYLPRSLEDSRAIESFRIAL